MADLDFSYHPEMCPRPETRSRVSDGMLHRFERPSHLVKKFTRSNAKYSFDLRVNTHRGKVDPDVRNLDVLLMTAKYLVKNFVLDQDNTLILERGRFDFVFDRLRAVRQDLAMQRHLVQNDDERARQILHICVRFHIVAGYLLCCVPISEFDPTINFTHTLECLKNLMVLYREDEEDSDDRIETFAIYLMLNLGEKEAIRWVYELNKVTRRQKLIQLAIEANVAYLERNFVKLFKLIRRMPILLQLAFHRKWPLVLRLILETMNVAYGSKVLHFPSSDFARLFCLDDQEQVQKICTNLGLTVNNEKISFLKTTVFNDKRIDHFHSRLLDENLEKTDKMSLLFPRSIYSD